MGLIKRYRWFLVAVGFVLNTLPGATDAWLSLWERAKTGKFGDSDFAGNLATIDWIGMAPVLGIIVLLVVLWQGWKRETGNVLAPRLQEDVNSDQNTNNNTGEENVYGPPGGKEKLVGLQILKQELLSAEAAALLEELDVVNPLARVLKIEVVITAEKLETVSFVRLSIGTTMIYPIQFLGARLQGSMKPLGIYFELDNWLSPGTHNATIGILAGDVPRWDEWDIQIPIQSV